MWGGYYCAPHAVCCSVFRSLWWWERCLCWNCHGSDVDQEVVPVVGEDVVVETLLELEPEFNGRVAVQGVASATSSELSKLTAFFPRPLTLTLSIRDKKFFFKSETGCKPQIFNEIVDDEYVSFWCPFKLQEIEWRLELADRPQPLRNNAMLNLKFYI